MNHQNQRYAQNAQIPVLLATFLELSQTQTDIVVYTPRYEGMDSGDNGNEHFLVFGAGNGDMLAM